MGLDLNLAYHPHSGHVTPVTEPTPPPMDVAPFGDASAYDLGAHRPTPLSDPHHSDDSNRYPSSVPASPASIRGGHPLRYNPMGTPSPAGSSSSSRRRSVDDSGNYSDDDPLPPPTRSIGESMTMSRKEATRKQRIEAEQRRRDELRDGYSRLREVLPSASHKGSKVALLDRATSYIVQLEGTNAQLLQRLQETENEVDRLRKLNETIAMHVASAGGNIAASASSNTPVLASPPDTASLDSDMGLLHVDDAGVDPSEIMPPPPKEEAASPA
ncbi:hypothetical protein EXIGLDRAFT_673664 [Exidia glandulosa HHB12029]|uniref:BHLH domain-containing protein n=1 Tax=Exidia glandulosa HHB12029 TaxID=1314781 RepID=A0A165ITG5_EXIGL|nr:hypothetical protein EXIGLDRAFT_673664 [Exidia glandulosa HHB12029]